MSLLNIIASRNQLIGRDAHELQVNSQIEANAPEVDETLRKLQDLYGR